MKKSLFLNIALACLVSVPATFAMNSDSNDSKAKTTPWYGNWPKTVQFYKNHKKKLIGGALATVTTLAGTAYAYFSNVAKEVVQAVPVAPVVEVIKTAPVKAPIAKSLLTTRNAVIGGSAVLGAITLYYIIKNAANRFLPSNATQWISDKVDSITPTKFTNFCKYKAIAWPTKAVTALPRLAGQIIVHPWGSAKTAVSSTFGAIASSYSWITEKVGNLISKKQPTPPTEEEEDTILVKVGDKKTLGSNPTEDSTQNSGKLEKDKTNTQSN